MLQLYFLCAHPSLTPSSAVAPTLRAVGGLTTRQITEAYPVPAATMAQRISRAKRTVAGVRYDQPGNVATALRVMYLVFNEGSFDETDLAAKAIQLTRQLMSPLDHPEAAGLLPLMLLHHARPAARTAPDGSLVPPQRAPTVPRGVRPDAAHRPAVKLPPAAVLTRAQYSGWACVFCRTPLTKGAVSAGRSAGRRGAVDLSVEGYACPHCAPFINLRLKTGAVS